MKTLHESSILKHRIGRRGASLFFLSFLDIVFGWSLLNPEPALKDSPAYKYIERYFSLNTWGAIWICTGIICLIGAFLKRDSFSFACAMLLKFVWGSVSFFSWLNAGVYRGYVGAAIWIAFAGFVGVLAGWPEPESEYSSPLSPTKPEGDEAIK